MELQIEKILPEKDLKKLSKESIKSINEAMSNIVDNAIDVKSKEVETTISGKFNTLVEGITKKFDDQVNTVIVENVKGNVSNSINKKFYTIIKGMVNLLENAGITTTEKTKELQEKLNSAKGNLKKSWDDMEAIKSQLTDSEKENFILAQLKGANPKIVNAALDFFKDKDILDVQDELQTFLDGDFSNLDLGSDRDDEMVGEVKLDQVKDVLDKMETSEMDKEERRETDKNKSQFESLNKGLKPQKVSKMSPNITNEDLADSAAIMENAEVEEDVKEAKDRINDFNSLGYNFK